MKIKGKKVIEIRPMTKREYCKRHIECCYCFDDIQCIVLINGSSCRDCLNQPAVVNGTHIMLVRCKK